MADEPGRPSGFEHLPWVAAAVLVAVAIAWFLASGEYATLREFMAWQSHRRP